MKHSTCTVCTTVELNGYIPFFGLTLLQHCVESDRKTLWFTTT